MSSESEPQNQTSPEPWYKDGLQFTCTQCGDCCTGPPGVVWVTDEEIQEIAAYLDKPVGEIRLFHTRIVRGRVSLTEYENGDCTFFDPVKRHCKVYKSRPVQCRTWPFWNSHLESPKAWSESAAFARGPEMARSSVSKKFANVPHGLICSSRIPEPDFSTRLEFSR